MDYQMTTSSKNRLSDRDMLLDLLITEKHLSSLYEQSVLEANSSMLANTFEQLQADTHDNARTIFNAMAERGWYSPAPRERRMSKQQPSKMTQAFDVAASSKYAVTSGSRRFGGHLAKGERLSKSGIYGDKDIESRSSKWQ